MKPLDHILKCLDKNSIDEKAVRLMKLFNAAPELLDACLNVYDRVSAWADGARIAAKQSEGTPSETKYRNEMMNYSHLADLLSSAIDKAEGRI